MGDLMAFIQANVLNDAQQHGVKGQKWGVRRDRSGSSGRPSGSKNSSSTDSRNTTVSSAVRKTAGALTGLRNSPKYKGKDLTKNPSLQKQYDAELMHIFKKTLVRTAITTGVVLVGGPAAIGAGIATGAIGVATSTTSSISANSEFGTSDSFVLHSADIQHADDGTPYRLIFKRDSLGFVTSIDFEEVKVEHHGVKGQKWGVRRAINPATGLVARTSSADQIHQDRVAKKLTTHGTKALSNKDIQDYVRRLQLQKELDKATKEAIPEKTHGFIRNYIHNQGARQIDRVANKAVDVAVEKAIEQFGLSLGKKGHNPDVVDSIVETSKRLKPKKK